MTDADASDELRSLRSGVALVREPSRAETGEGGDRWQDIASAPRDGSDFLAICASAYSPEATVAWWGTTHTGTGWVHYSRPEEKMSGGTYIWFPTHWMPLPKPPASREGSGTARHKEATPHTPLTLELLEALAQLRHAYSHLRAERVTNQRGFADGLIAPVIRWLEGRPETDTLAAPAAANRHGEAQ